MSALAKAFEFLAQRYTCTAVNLTGMKPGQMPRVDFTWANNRYGEWWAWEVFHAAQGYDLEEGQAEALRAIGRAVGEPS